MRVALVSEGTYPFAMGGVSVWCDQLIRGLDDYEWEMVALTVDGEEEQVWESPDNLVRVRSIELWGPTPTGGRRSRSPGPAFAHAYEEFLATLISPLRQSVEDQSVVRRRFLHALRGLYDYAAGGGNLSHALTSNDALTVMMDAWSEVQTTHLSLADALEAAWLIEHMLRPLAAKPVEADIVHASMNGLSMLVAMASKWRYGTPVVMSEHGIYLRERYLSYVNDNAPHGVKVLILSFFRMLAGAGYLVADALAPHSSYNRRWQLQNGADPERMWTMYNGVPPDEFPKADSEPDEPTIVFMGRIDPLKDLHTLIRAFALVHKEIPEAKLRMFGSTPHGNEVYHESCVDLIEELDLTGIAVLEGRVSTPVHAYHAGSIVALTSISEGFPYTVVEAMACGRSVVATNVGGVAEAVADTGFVVAPRDFKAVADACVKLLADDAMRNELATKAHERVMARFTLIQSLNAYRAVYEHVTEEEEPASTESVKIGAQRTEPETDTDPDSEASESLVRTAAMMPAGEHP
ncbi:GT4 family glycosyltransferase PelF [Tenggerimyces flavus]|uniref:GT4 family glycosyltransferase PelF n=1 Tax=Tenggerimyces flavus TaxID=1708749 RepID=A0ABV7Y6J2_9ACTN|nr:GT4 family glycosyltransferase PelF [Tenggerimyces flavus]MBM7790501.1 glycosyltransferase involved in cell wall biosynthesis [Tenggerimyces flavus]